ncbi:hypothetical protein K5E40_03830 [Pseudomonas baetica]|uniref:hypothetical protein n=1 Tax=Pseudomonas baetica TaxID=674054 RepID=UPI001C8C3A20|nr:hypothetical protein [Pseudomonas baetica]MBX9404805.1 hypothetical protein [Pseudomonas baetica]
MSSFYWRWATSTLLGTHYLRKYCPKWDAALNRLIDKHWESVEVGEHTAKLGEAHVWISNAFYSYGTQFMGVAEFRPSVRTMRRLDSLVRYEQAKKEEKKREEHLKQMEGF